MNRHLHHHPDGLVEICTRAWCAPSPYREKVTSRVLLASLPLAAVMASAVGRRGLGVTLAVLAVAAVVVRGVQILGARIARDARGGDAPARDDDTRAETGHHARSVHAEDQLRR